jgi:DnaJ-class molecular chaperone
MNYAGKIIIDTDRGYTSIGNFVTFTKRFPYTMTGYKGECDINGKQISKIKVETPKQAVASSSSSSSSSSNNSNSGNNTTTIHVEHHHDPVPVQQWQACFACGGMGTMGCDNCGGSGTKYIGDNLRICSRCNGRGIIPCNICYGNKGQYITVYR